MDSPVTQRYEIRRELGRGGAGVVYEALDRQTQGVVALKTIETQSGEPLYQLKHEFRLLAEVQHRNLVRLGELSCEGDRWFFTMQLVKGKPLLDYVRTGESAGVKRPYNGSNAASVKPSSKRPWSGPGAPGGGVAARASSVGAGPSGRVASILSSRPAWPRTDAAGLDRAFDEARLRGTLVQVVQALSALHDAGYVHRDVKPSNILVSDDGHVVLLDFGISQLIRRHESTGTSLGIPGTSLGTPAYIAPEVIEGEVAGPAADLYSVGVMLYQALTGKLPFSGADYEVMEAKLLRLPQSPGSLAPDAPSGLLALCEDLLQMDPGKRPAAGEVLRRLGENAAVADDPYAAGVDVDAKAPFIGRSAELGILRRAFAAVEDGQTCNVLVEGEPGVGKSMVVTQFLATLGSEVLLLSGRCYEQESVPFKGVDSIVDALTDHLCTLDDDEVSELLAGGVRYLSSLFPVLTRVDAVREGALEGSQQVASEGALRELATSELGLLLDALARRAPLVMFIDDLQWADNEGLSLLGRVLLRPERSPGLFIATARPVADPSPGLATVLAESERIVLDVFSAEEAQALWSTLSRAKAGEDPMLSENVLRDAGGHPLLLAELALAQADGRHMQHGGQVRLQDVLWERVTAREPIERRFLEMLAVAGTPTAYEVVARAADLSVGECMTRLTGLKTARLIRISRRGNERAVELYHDRLREAIAERLAARADRGRRLQDHKRLGMALQESTLQEGLSPRVYAIVHHLGIARELLTTSRERRELAELYLLACQTARFETAFERAHDYARAGLGLLSDSGWTEAYELTRDLSLQLMATDYLTGRAEDARVTFDAVQAKLASSEERVAVYVSRIWIETANGHPRPALAATRKILRELGTPLPAYPTLGHVLVQLAEYRLRQGRRSLDELVHLPALQSSRIEGALEVLAASAPAAFLTDDLLHGWIRLRITNLSLQHGVSKVSCMGFAGLGLLLVGAFHRYDEAAASLRLALKLNERFQNDVLAPELFFVKGCYVDPWTEPFAKGVAELQHALELATQQGNTAIEGYVAMNLAMTSYQEGTTLSELQELGERAYAFNTHRGMADMAAIGKTLSQYAAVLRGLSEDKPTEPAAGTQNLLPFTQNLCTAEIAFFSEDFERAERFARLADKQAPMGTLQKTELVLLNLMLAARRYEHAPLHERPHLMWVLRKELRMLRSCARSCPENFEAHYLIGLGELLRTRGRTQNATDVFERAAESARTNGSAKREALALQLAARHAAQQGASERARALEEKADDAYHRWGAVLRNRRQEQVALRMAAFA